MYLVGPSKCGRSAACSLASLRPIALQPQKVFSKLGETEFQLRTLYLMKTSPRSLLLVTVLSLGATETSLQ